jgi:hypothetical protein
MTNTTIAHTEATRVTYRRFAHFDLYAYDGRWLGMGFGYSAHDAANHSSVAGRAPVAYAKSY